jgi:predicted translin family RNA/ssDNA-binding protein
MPGGRHNHTYADPKLDTENRDNLIRILSNVLEDSRQAVKQYFTGTMYECDIAIKQLRDTLKELERT